MLQDAILSAADIPPPTPVPTPEWPAVDGQIFVVRLATSELASMWAWFTETAKDGDAFAPYVAVSCAREADGKTPVFSRDKVADLAAKAGSAVSRIFAAADELNYLTELSRAKIRKN